VGAGDRDVDGCRQRPPLHADDVLRDVLAAVAAGGGAGWRSPRVEAIAEAARRLDGLRRNWLDPEGAPEAELKKRTLTNLYNARPTWLANAHAVLDRAVFAAYGWPPDIADEDILKELLALNLERSSGEAG